MKSSPLFDGTLLATLGAQIVLLFVLSLATGPVRLAPATVGEALADHAGESVIVPWTAV